MHSPKLLIQAVYTFFLWGEYKDLFIAVRRRHTWLEVVGACPNRILAPNRFRSAFFTSRVRLSLLPLFPALLPHTPAAAGNAHQCPEGNGACVFEMCEACL